MKTTVYKNNILKLLIRSQVIVFIKLFLCISSQSSSANPIQELTVSQQNTTLVLPYSDELNKLQAETRAQQIFEFIQARIYPKVPKQYLSQILTQKLTIHFRSKLKKAGLFIPPNSDSQNTLSILIRDNLLYDETFYRVLAHEWFHALHYTVLKDEPSWVREGLAQVFEVLVFESYNLNLKSAFESSNTTLFHDFDIQAEDREAYGHVFIFFYSLTERAKNTDLFWKLVSQGVQSPSSLNEKIIQAEIARFHNRRIYTTPHQDQYWLFKDLLSERSILKTDLSLFKSQFEIENTFNSLKVYQPIALHTNSYAALKKWLVRTKNDNKKWVLYTIEQKFPYQVLKGLNSSGMKEKFYLLIKTRE